MAEITFTGNKLLKSINKEWCTKFPYLYLSFYRADGKPQESWTVTHASIRGKKDADELSINANMKVGTFEKRYQEAFGAKIEIKYIKGGRTYKTLGEHNELTLAEMNAWVKDHGGAEVMKEKPDWF
jgi:hypothetical protein